MNTFEAQIKSKEHGIELISLVDDPANKTGLLPVCGGLASCELSNGNEFIVPVLIPNQEIRRKENEDYFNIVFPKEVIKQAFVDFMGRKKLSVTDVNHDGKVMNKKVLFLENWIKESDMDKSNNYFDLPVGTWFTKVKILDPNLIKKIEDKEINGVSIYGKFEFILINNYTMLSKLKEMQTSLSKLVGLAEETPSTSVEDRLKALEDAMASLLESLSKEEVEKLESEEKAKEEEVKQAEEKAVSEEEKAKEEEAKAKEEETKKEDEKTEMEALKVELAALRESVSKIPVNGNPKQETSLQAVEKVLTLSEIIEKNKQNK